MRLKITDVNFTTKFDWLMKLCDENGNEFFIMNESFYKRNGYSSPITKKELDSYDHVQWITTSVAEIGDKQVVIVT